MKAYIITLSLFALIGIGTCGFLASQAKATSCNTTCTTIGQQQYCNTYCF